MNFTTFRPTADHNFARYTASGLYSHADFSSEIPDHLSSILSKAANASLSKETWSSYNSGLKMFQTCQDDLQSRWSPPLKDSELLTYVGWLLNRNLSTATINTYLAALRHLYIKLGLDPASIRNELVKQILRGREHQQLTTMTAGENKSRLPVTPAILKLIKMDLKDSCMKPERKLLFWSVATLCFAGAFRIHELLSKHHAKFEPINTLLGQDVKLRKITLDKVPVLTLQITLKQEKTNSSKSPTVLDIFQSSGPLCPISAFKKWKSNTNSIEDDLPCFRSSDGRALTGREFNLYLAAFSKKYFRDSKGKISSHSFRIGLASTLGKLGFTDPEIQQSGHWSSRAFEAYLKLPRTKRAAVAREIGKIST